MKAFLGICGCLFVAAELLRGPPVSDLDRLVLALVGALAIRGVGALIGAVRRGLRGPAAKHPLDTVLFQWSPDDPFTLGDLFRNVAIFGQTGSGKTSGSGLQIGKAIVRHRKSGGLILASKPEDREFWERIFRDAGRKDDLLIFGPNEELRCNFIDFEMQAGGDARSLTQFITVIGETLGRSSGGGGGRSDDAFWQKSEERLTYNAVEAVRQGLGRVTAPDLQKLIATAAVSAEQLSNEAWKKDFHSECLRKAGARRQTVIEAHDLELILDFWLTEYPVMDERPRSCILAGVQNTLHTFNTGIVRELVSTTTNCSPASMDQGKWILVDMPLDQYGASGKFVLTGWKFLTQKHVLRRKAGPGDSPIVIWCDEAQEVLNSFDASFLAKCRSHMGCLVYLTQSIHSYYGAMGQGHQGEHQANALLTNFLHKVFHVVGDAQTASYASSLLGQRREILGGGSLSPAPEPFDILMGRARFSGSFSEHYQPVLQNNAFMHGMRTGGARHQMVVDGIVVRSGEPFSTGENWLWVSFGQE